MTHRTGKKVKPQPVIPGSWAERAACRGHDPEDWFVKTRYRHARAVCWGCPVRINCLDHILSTPTTEIGVWGGLDEDQRRELRRRGRTA